jgi:CBS domain-containing protein
MNVSDLMTTSPITVSPETPVLDARQLMVEKRIRHLLVIEARSSSGSSRTGTSG